MPALQLLNIPGPGHVQALPTNCKNFKKRPVKKNICFVNNDCVTTKLMGQLKYQLLTV
jgi:hypothetical protein